MSSALAGGFLTTASPGKSLKFLLMTLLMLLALLSVFYLFYKIVVSCTTQCVTESLTKIMMTKQLEMVDQIYSFT